MAAYYSIDLLFSRENIYPEFVGDVYKAFKEAGMKYKDCLRETKKTPDSKDLAAKIPDLKDVTAVNQAKLNDDFELGIAESFQNDYIQTYFEYGGYSEVRCFIINYHADNNLSFTIIVPEDDIMPSDDKYWAEIVFEKDKLSGLIELSKKLWEKIPSLSAITTNVEYCDGINQLHEISPDRMPILYPFAILPKNMCKFEIGENISTESIPRDGVFILDISQLI